MDLNQTSYCTVLDLNTQKKLICYTRRKNGLFWICLTDATDVWRSEFTEDQLQEFRLKFALKSTEDYILKLRSCNVVGELSLLQQGDSAQLQVGSGPASSCVSLVRLEQRQAEEELKELLFRMADSLTALQGVSTSVSPLKTAHTRPADFEPRQQQSGAASQPVKRRLPGASLINPGAKKKMEATGVAFDDED